MSPLQLQEIFLRVSLAVFGTSALIPFRGLKNSSAKDSLPLLLRANTDNGPFALFSLLIILDLFGGGTGGASFWTVPSIGPSRLVLLGWKNGSGSPSYLARGGEGWFGSPSYLARGKEGWGGSPTYLVGAHYTYLPGRGQVGTPSLLKRMSNTCRNIPFPRTAYVVGKYYSKCGITKLFRLILS